ncbi:MAG: hypothetical protein Q7T57_04185 [Dehalococcoidales bacterium]|nr:hypothetical protein [Dehalococcoidales bacterium]
MLTAAAMDTVQRITAELLDANATSAEDRAADLARFEAHAKKADEQVKERLSKRDVLHQAYTKLSIDELKTKYEWIEPIAPVAATRDESKEENESQQEQKADISDAQQQQEQFITKKLRHATATKRNADSAAQKRLRQLECRTLELQKLVSSGGDEAAVLKRQQLVEALTLRTSVALEAAQQAAIFLATTTANAAKHPPQNKRKAPPSDEVKQARKERQRSKKAKVGQTNDQPSTIAADESTAKMDVDVQVASASSNIDSTKRKPDDSDLRKQAKRAKSDRTPDPTIEHIAAAAATTGSMFPALALERHNVIV